MESVTTNKLVKVNIKDVLLRKITIKDNIVSYEDNEHEILTDVERSRQFEHLSEILDKLPLKIKSDSKLKKLKLEELIFQRAVDINIIKLGEEMQFRLGNPGHYHLLSFDNGAMHIGTDELIGVPEDVESLTSILYMSCAAILSFAKSIRDPHVVERSFVLHQIVHWLFVLNARLIPEEEKNLYPYTHFYLSPDFLGYCEDCIVDGVNFNGLIIVDFKNTNNKENHIGALNKYTPPMISLMIQSSINSAYIVTQELTDDLLKSIETRISSDTNPFILGSLAIIKICMGLLKNDEVKNLLADDRDYQYYHVDIPEVSRVDQYASYDKDEIAVNFLTGIYLNAFDKNMPTLEKDDINSIVFRILSDECTKNDDGIIEKVVMNIRKFEFKKKKHEQDSIVKAYLTSLNRSKEYEDYTKGIVPDDLADYLNIKLPNKIVYESINVNDIKETIKKNVMLINNKSISLTPMTVVAEEVVIDSNETIEDFIKTVKKSDLSVDSVRDIINDNIIDNHIFQGVEENCTSIKRQFDNIKSLVKDNDKLDNKLKPSLTPSIFGDKYTDKELGIPLYNPKSDYSLKANDIDYILKSYQATTYTKVPDTRGTIPNYNIADNIMEIQYICDNMIETLKLNCTVKEFLNSVDLDDVPNLKEKIEALDQGPYINSYYYKDVYDSLGIILEHAIEQDLNSDTSFILETKHASMCECHTYRGNQTVSSAIVNNDSDIYGKDAKYYRDYILESSKDDCDLYESLRKIAVLYQYYLNRNDRKMSMRLLSFLENYDGTDVSDIQLKSRSQLFRMIPKDINLDDTLLKKTANQNPYYRKIEDDVLKKVMNIGLENYNVEHAGTTHPNCILGLNSVDRFLEIINGISDDDFIDYLKNIQVLWNNVIMDASRVGIGIDRYVIKHLGNTYYMFNKSNDMYRLLLIYDAKDIKNFLHVETFDEIRLFLGEALITDKIVAIRYNMTDADIYASMRALSYFYIWRMYESAMNIPEKDRRYKFITIMSLKNRFYTCEYTKNLRYFIPNITQDLNNISNLFKDKIGPIKDDKGVSLMKFNSYDMITTTLFVLYERYIDEVLRKYAYRDDVQILYGLKSMLADRSSDIQEIIDLPEDVRHAILYNGSEINKSVVPSNASTKGYNKYKFIQTCNYDEARKYSRVSIENIRLYFFNAKYSVNNERMFTDYCMTYHFEYGGSQSYTSAAKDLIGKLIKYQYTFMNDINNPNFYTMKGLYKVFEMIKKDMNTEMGTQYTTWKDAFLSESKLFYSRFIKKFMDNGGYIETSSILKLDPFSMVLFTEKLCNDYKLPKFDMSFIKTDLFSIAKNKSMSNDSIEHFYEPRSDKFQEFIIKNPDKCFENIIELQKNVLFVNDKETPIAFVPKDRMKDLKDCQILVLKFGTPYINDDIEGYKLEMKDYYKICYLFRRSKRKIRLNNMVHLMVLSTIDGYFEKCGIYKLAAGLELSEEEIENLYLATGYDIKFNQNTGAKVDIDELESDILKSKITLVSVIKGMCGYRFVFQVAFKDGTGENREFYIVNFPARLCIGFLDKVFSYYCTKCPNEFISVPGNKKMNVINHLVSDVSKHDDANHTTVLMSCDCSKWSNKAVMLEYQLIIATMHHLGIFDPLLYDTLMNIIIKIQNKWMEVPKEYIHNKETELNDFFYYMGEYYLQLSSTWGQGQINYLSSFKHAIVANMIKYILSNDDDVFYSMVHSDDSAYIFQTPQVIPRKVLANRVVHTVAIAYSLFNQTVNTKKTSIGGFMEFCSTFYTYKSSNIGMSRLIRIEYTPSISNPMIDFLSYFSKIKIWFNEGVPLNLLKLLLDAMKFIWLLWYKPHGASPVTGNPTAIDIYDCIYGDIIYSFKSEDVLKSLGIDPESYYSEYCYQIDNPDTEIVDNKLYQLLRIKSNYKIKHPLTPQVMQDEISHYDTLICHEMKKFTNVMDLRYIHEIHPEFDILEVPENVKGFKIFGIFDNYSNNNFIDSFNNRDNRSKFVERFRLNSHLYVDGFYIKLFLDNIHEKYKGKINYKSIWSYIRSSDPSNDLVDVHYDKFDYTIKVRDAIEKGKYSIVSRNDQSQCMFYCRKQDKQVNNHLSKTNILAIIYANDQKMYKLALHSEIVRGLYPEKPEYRKIQDSISQVDYSSPVTIKRSMKKLVYLLTLGKDNPTQKIVPFNSDLELYLTLNTTIKLPIKMYSTTITILNRNLKVYRDYVDPSLKFQIDSGVYSINGDLTDTSTDFLDRYSAYVSGDILTPFKEYTDNKTVESMCRMIVNKLDPDMVYNAFKESSLHWRELYNVDFLARIGGILNMGSEEIERSYNSSYIAETDTVKSYIYKDYHQYISMGENMKYYINNYEISDQFSGVVFGVKDLSYTYMTDSDYIAMHFYLNINIMGLPCSAFTIGRRNTQDYVISLLSTHMRSYVKWETVPSISGNFIINNGRAMTLYGRYVILLDYDIASLSQYQILICMCGHYSILCNDILFYSIDHTVRLSCPITLYDPDHKFDVFTRGYCDDNAIINIYKKVFNKDISMYWYNDMTVVIDENFIYKSAEYVYQTTIDLIIHDLPSLNIQSTKVTIRLNKNMQSLMMATATIYNSNKDTYKNWITITNFILKEKMDSLYYKQDVVKYVRYNIKKHPKVVEELELPKEDEEPSEDLQVMIRNMLRDQVELDSDNNTENTPEITTETYDNSTEADYIKYTFKPEILKISRDHESILLFNVDILLNKETNPNGYNDMQYLYYNCYHSDKYVKDTIENFNSRLKRLTEIYGVNIYDASIFFSRFKSKNKSLFNKIHIEDIEFPTLLDLLQFVLDNTFMIIDTTDFYYFMNDDEHLDGLD